MRYFNDGQEIKLDDLNGITTALERDLYERVINELLGSASSHVFYKGAFRVTRTSSTGLSVANGLGFQYDGTQPATASKRRMLWTTSPTALSISAADPSHDRIDIVCVRVDQTAEVTATRNFKNGSTDAVTAQSMTVQMDWSPTFSVVAGTPSVSPAVPSTPTGYVKLAEVYVTAVTGIAASGAITDKRTVSNRTNGRKITSVSSAYSVLIEDELILANGTFNVTLPAAADAYDSTNGVGRQFTIKNIGSGTVTVVGTIDGEANQALASQYTDITVVSNGTVYYML